MKIFLAFLVSFAVSVTGALFLSQPGALGQPENLFSKLSAPATATKPSLVIGFSNAQSQLDDIESFIDTMIDNKFEAGIVKGFFSALLSKLAPTKRAGAVVFTEETPNRSHGLLFLPVEDKDQFMELLEGLGEVKKEALGKGSILQLQSEKYYFTERDEYFYFSNEKAAFERIVDNPQSWLADIPSNYNVGLVYNTDRISSATKQAQLQLLRRTSTELTTAARKTSLPDAPISDDFQSELLHLVEQTRELKLGFDVNAKNRQLELFAMCRGVESTELASLGTLGAALPQSRYANFRDGKAFVNFNMQTPIVKSPQSQLKQVIGMLDASQFSDKRLRRLVDELHNVLQHAVSDRDSFDGAFVARGEKQSGEFAAVFSAGDTTGLASLIRDLGKPQPIRPSAFGAISQQQTRDSRMVKLNGLRFYQQLIKTPMKPNLSGSLIVAAGDDEVYVGFGKRPLGLMKSCLSQPEVNESERRSDILLTIDLKNLPLPVQDVEIKGRALIRGDVDYVESGFASRLLIDTAVIKACYDTFLNMQ